MQISSTRVFVFVEGRETDAFFYSEICRPVCEAARLQYEVVRADRVGGAGGKKTLIGLYEHLRINGSLKNYANGKRSFCIFYLDKDADDILREIIESPHVAYTPFYNVENALFIYGQIVKAAAAAASLDAAIVAARIPDDDGWRRKTAEQWKEFVVFCLFSRKHGENCDCTYGSDTSPLNNPPDAPTNRPGVVARKAELQARLLVTAEVFERKFEAAQRLVERIYRKGQHDLVFNGKWYFTILMRDIHLAAGGQKYNRHALKNGLAASLTATLNFDAPWVEYFRMPLRVLIDEAIQ